ncbi:MAG: ABC transporter ATP-binding protein [Parachlamydiaceae bacterium]|nr:ABC transporter ATP-binding protein [Parachlamydiaceae bacterium]
MFKKNDSIPFYIFSMVSSFRSALFSMFFVAFVWAIDLSVRPYVLKMMIDRIGDLPREEVLGALAFPALLFIALSFTLSSSFRLYDYFVQYKMIPSLRKKIAVNAISHLLQQSHHYYQNQFSGSLGNKVSDLLMNIPEVIQSLIDRFFSHFIALTIAIVTLFMVSPYFALILFLWAGLFTLGAYLYAPHLTKLANAWSSLGSQTTGKIVDVISNILAVRLFARPRQEMDYLEKMITDTSDAEKTLQWSNLKMWFIYGYSFALVLGLNLYLLIKGYHEGWVSIGDFALVLGINSAVIEFLWQLAREFSQFTKQYGRVTQAYTTIYEKIDITNAADAKDLEVTAGEIVFDQVAFRYKGSEPLFSNKSLTIAPGQKVGLVGYSGSGKTTFVNLILRLFDVIGGKIMIDGQDISKVTLDSLRSAIALIPQDPSLFHRSLMDNIRYGRLDALDGEVVEAARLAHANEFIAGLELNYDAMVGERGIKLSGGQRQRIAIARAILKDAPILILDEATSQLDSITESDIQDSLWPLMQGRTTLVIAHRLSTLLNMDRILVFTHGVIVEDGTHAELLAKKGQYKALWDAQVGGFLPE